jgi:RNA polymerase sigma-70 factor (ECF subfamily)
VVSVRSAVYLEKVGSGTLIDTQGELLDEAVLIQKAKDFDSGAWTHIYRHHYPRIYAYLCHRLGDIDMAEDIAAVVFLHAVEGIDSYTYRGFSLSSWLFRIAHNQMADHFRRKAKEKTEPLTEERLSKSGTVQEAMEEVLVREDLNLALKNITEEQQQVVLLKFFSGLSNAEVARIIRKPEGAVKALQHRALASLRRILEREERNGERL